jgi:cyclophilin family peptidyl-prolyl cis-trans isomerase
LKIIQGGGYDNTGAKLPASAPVPLEYAYPNMRGTIAMARTQNVNSATREWFFNFKDNTTDLGPGNGGGYTAFGQVVGPGMSVIDAIGNLPEFDLDGAGQTFDDVPLFNYTQTDYNNGVNALPHLVILQSVSVVKTHASFQNPYNSLDINNNNSVNANDAANVIQALLLKGNHDLTATFGSEGNRLYLDVNGDGKVTAQDALQVVQAVLLSGASATPATFTAGPTAVPLAVPEPSSLALGALAASALLGVAWRKRRRRAA